MRKTEWNGEELWNINEEVREAVKKTVSAMSEDELQAIRDRDRNIFEVTYSLEDLNLGKVTLKDVWPYINVYDLEVGHFVVAAETTTMYHADREYAEERHGLAAWIDYSSRTINLAIVVVDRNKDYMELYSDDEGYGWEVPIRNYQSLTELVQKEANFNNGLCIIRKKKGA